MQRENWVRGLYLAALVGLAGGMLLVSLFNQKRDAVLLLLLGGAALAYLLISSFAALILSFVDASRLATIHDNRRVTMLNLR